jgi:hypothetical protein
MELIKMKPSRKKPKEGDVFVIQPKEGLYLYGKVIRTKIPSKNIMINGWNLIYVYRKISKNIVMPDYLVANDLLIPPQIVNNQGWLKGYFQTIGSLPVTEKDKSINYGFLDFKTKEYVNEEGKPLGYKPEMWTDYGIGSYGSVASDIKTSLESKLKL